MMELTAHSSPWRMAVLILSAVGFVVLGAWFVGLFGEAPSSHRWPPEIVRLIGWTAIIVFGATAPLLVRRAFDDDAQLTISARGIRSKPWSEDTIPWGQIRDVSVWEHRRQRMIILSLYHPERYPSRSLLGMLAGVNRVMTGGEIPISLTGLDKSFDEAFAAIRQFWPPR